MSRLSRFLFPLLAVLPAGPAMAQPVGTFSLPASLVDSLAALQWIQKVPAFCEGPAWDGMGSVYFTEQHGRDTAAWPIWKVDLRGSAPAGAVILSASDQANGLAFDPDGRLVACQRRKVSRIPADGAGTAISLADSSAALPFGFANDLAFGSDGSFFFTALDSLVYRVAAGGAARVAARGLKGANGILWAEEAGLLYVGDAADSQVVRYRVGPDGALGGPAPHIRMTRPDGMAMDAQGNLYVASVAEGRIRVFGPGGDSLGHIALDPPAPYNGYKRGVNGNASNCEFGGPDGRTLYITGDGGLYALRLKVSGRVLPEPVRLGSRPFAFPPRPASWPGHSAAPSAAASAALTRILRAGTLAGRLEAPILLGRRLVRSSGPPCGPP